MTLVLFLFGTIAIISLIIILFSFSTVRINIENLEIKNIKFQYDFNIKISIYFLNIFPLIVVHINKDKIKSNNILNTLESKQNISIFKYLPRLKPNIMSINLKVDLGTEDAIYTSILATLLSIAISSILPIIACPKKYKKIYYKINPSFSGRNVFYLKLKSIISVKMIHIISIIYIILKKRRVEKNERTSDRRAYANSYE